MSEFPRPLRLTHLTWPEVARLRPQVRLVAIPVGSIEQHGPNSSLDTDSVICEDLTLRLAERFHPQILVAPVVPFGMATYHMSFPGTLTMRPATYLALLEDVVASLLHHGFDTFLITNWHNGNEAGLTLAMQGLPTRYPLRFLGTLSFYDLEPEELEKELIKSDSWGHADELETGELLALRPDRVKVDALTPGALTPDGLSTRRRFWRRRIMRSSDFSDMTTNGAVGNATLASAADGRRMLAAIEERADELVRDLLNAPAAMLQRGRILQWRNGPSAR
ncbi:MAG: creatininase family protein [Actinobacteria bacterium]|nr:creatininase family protein [Actinomycetota bacterium]